MQKFNRITCGWIPVRIVNDDPISATQVQAETADFGREQENKYFRIAIKPLNNSVARARRRCAVHFQVAIVFFFKKYLKYFEHLPALAEQKHPIVLLFP